MLTAVIGLVAVVLGIIYFLNKSRAEEDGKIPGMKPSDPKTGNLQDLARAGNIHSFTLALHKKYGPIASFYWGPKYTISVADPQMFKELRTHFTRSPELFEQFMMVITNKSIQVTNGPKGQRMYSTLKKSFSHTALFNYQDTLNMVAGELNAKFSACSSDDPVPVMQTFFKSAIKVIAIICFGKYFTDDEHLEKLRRSYDELVTTWERWAQGGTDELHKRCMKDRELFYNTVKTAIESHKSRRKPTDASIFVDDLLDLCGDDEDELLCNAVTFFIGGFQTTALLMTWSMYYLSVHQDVQQKLLDEILGVLEDDQPFTPDMLSKFKFFPNVLLEANRCAILAPFAGREAEKDLVLGGYNIKKGTAIVLSMGAMHMNESLGWQHPEKYDPDRLSDEAAKSRHPCSFQPFGLGKRICPGFTLSMYEAHVLLSTILRKFRVTLAEGQQVTPQYGFMTKPAEEFYINLHKRQ